MNDIATLWYVDSRRILRGIRAIFRNPSRAIAWLAFALYFGWRFTLRQQRPTFFPPLHEPFVTGIAAAIVAFAGYLMWMSASSSRVRSSREPAETLFLARSAIPERLVAAWIYGRYFLATYGRTVAVMLFLALLYHRGGFAPIAAIAGLLLAIEMARIPIAYASRRRRWLAPACAALACIGLALIGIDAAAFAVPELSPLRSLVLAPHLGPALVALWNGQPSAVAAVYGSAVLFVFLGWRLAADIYPELYASASVYQDMRRRVREGRSLGTRFAPRVSKRATRSGTTRLSGPWVEIWKQIAFLRRANGTQIIAAVLAVSIVLGCLAGFAERSDRGLGFVIISSLCSVCAIILAATNVSLARDIAKPLWWMGEGTLFSKLIAWSIGSALPVIVPLALAIAIAWTISPAIALAGIFACAVVLPIPLRGIATLCYAVLPNPFDQRGPGFLLRLLIIYASAGVALGAGFGGGLLLQSVWLGVIAGIATFVLEGIGAIALAARVIAGRGVTFASAETT